MFGLELCIWFEGKNYESVWIDFKRVSFLAKSKKQFMTSKGRPTCGF